MNETETTTERTFGMRISSETKDDRRNKDYRRTLTVTVYQADGPEIKTDDLPSNYTSDPIEIPHLGSALEGIFGHEGRVEPTWGREFGYHLTFTFKADKPSSIISEEQAFARLVDKTRGLMRAASASLEEDTEIVKLEGRDVLLRQVSKALNATLEEHDRIRALVKRRNDACRLASWIAKDADKAARGIVRFEQRMAALVAELEAEQRVQLQERLKAGGKLDTETDAWNEEIAQPGYVPEKDVEKTPWDKRSVEAARKYADRCLPSASPTSRMFGMDNERAIKLGEVE